MPFLIAQGAEFEHRWRRPLREGMSFVIGRTAAGWAVPWDERVSRRHARLTYERGQLIATLLPEARNPLFYRGQKASEIKLKPGEHFVVGGTTFSLVEERAEASLDAPAPITERTFEPLELQCAPFRHPDRRIHALAKLPELIATSSSDAEQFARLLNVVLSGFAGAQVVALVRKTEAHGPVEILHWDRRSLHGRDFLPSQRLIQQALAAQKSVLHRWKHNETSPSFTLQAGLDWAWCLPLTSRCTTGLALYLSGELNDASDDEETLRDDLKFAELAAFTYQRLCEARWAERRLAGFGQFLSPNVLQALAESDPDTLLAPREAEVTVLFCDLRGFTRRSELAASHLFDLLERVSAALGVMTREILANGGVIGDFHGDSAMGFWGWPFPLTDAPARAAAAALAIQHAFQSSEANSLLHDFRIGIGIATGRAVAGKIGTQDQVKITAFGPVVNLAARLETLTKKVGCEILLDAPTAVALTSAAISSHCRRVGKFQLWGLPAPTDVWELPAASPLATSETEQRYAMALEAFELGEWNVCRDLLTLLPSAGGDGSFIARFMRDHAYRVPTPWTGIVEFHEK